MTVSLAWEGPVGPGEMPLDSQAFERLCETGVYIRLKSYERGRTIAYAGQSVSLLARFDQHLTKMLSLATPLRDSTGCIVFTGDSKARLEAYNQINDAVKLAAADVTRVRFWYALCDDYFQPEHLNLVEGLLQRRMMARLEDIENRMAAPTGASADVPHRWVNDLARLDLEGRGILEDLFGLEPMTPDVLHDNDAY